MLAPSTRYNDLLRELMTEGLQNGTALGHGAVLQAIRHKGPITRAGLVAHTGLGRSTVSQRVDALLERQLVRPAGEGRSTGGRPPTTLEFNSSAGVVLAADLGATHARLSVTDLSGTPLIETSDEIHVDAGPNAVMDRVEQRFDELLAEIASTRSDVRGVGFGVPGPVEFAMGRPVSPPIMPGWDGYPIAQRLRERYNVPALVDNDVNIMALGEFAAYWPEAKDLLFVKVGTGIGCGIIAHGAIYRGSQGGAGDIGHIPVRGHDEVVCHCGNVGCLEAVAGGAALARQAREQGFAAHDSRDVVELMLGQNPGMVALLRQAGRLLGEVLSGLVNALNPAVIVIGGDIARAEEPLFAGVREVVYQRSTALATRHLQIVGSQLGDRAGVRGASIIAIEHILSPDAIDANFRAVA